MKDVWGSPGTFSAFSHHSTAATSFGQLSDYAYFSGRDPIFDIEDMLRDDGYTCFNCTECGSLIDPDDWIKVFNDEGAPVFCSDGGCGIPDELCDECMLLDLSEERPECENGCTTEPVLGFDHRFVVHETSDESKRLEKERSNLVAMLSAQPRRGRFFLYAGSRVDAAQHGCPAVPFTMLTSEPCAVGVGLQLIGSFDNVEAAELAGDIDVAWRKAGWDLTSVEVAAKLGLDSVAELAKVPFADLLPYLTPTVGMNN